MLKEATQLDKLCGDLPRRCYETNPNDLVLALESSVKVRTGEKQKTIMGNTSYNLNTRHVEREVKYDSNNGERMKNKRIPTNTATQRGKKRQKEENAP